jgi:acetyl-CoA hydrolase
MTETASAAAAAIDLRGLLRAGDTVIWGQACAEPITLTRALVQQQGAVGPVRCFLGIGTEGGPELLPGSDLEYVAYGGGGTTRRLDGTGALDILPSRYSDLPRLFRTRAVPIDVAFVQVTPGIESGTYHFAVAADYLVAAARCARVIVAEVNLGAPRTPDAPVLRAEEIAAVVPAQYRPLELSSPPPSEVDRLIAEHVAAIVPDGATLQLGIGTLPEAIVRGLGGHRDLGIHSGAIGDAVADLIRAGAVTNAHKVHDRGVTVAGCLTGTRALFEVVDGNPDVALRDTTYTHDPTILTDQPRLISINAAIEVDLTGQINSEVAGGRYVGAAGGSLDFARAATLSEGGASVIALRSSVAGRSAIVPVLSGPVTMPRSEVGWVVTEYGAVNLRGLTLSQRRERLLSIAHPDHREALAAAPAGPGESRSSLQHIAAHTQR